MQKIINVLSIASFVVSVSVVGGGIYVYANKDALIKSVTEKALGGLGGLGGSLGGDLPIGTPDLVPPTPQASVGGGSMGLPVPGKAL
jgi:hypothetical protein